MERARPSRGFHVHMWRIVVHFLVASSIVVLLNAQVSTYYLLRYSSFFALEPQNLRATNNKISVFFSVHQDTHPSSKEPQWM